MLLRAKNECNAPLQGFVAIAGRLLAMSLFVSSVLFVPAIALSAPVKLKLTYFDIEGVAECVRLALVLSKVDFEDERVEFANWKDIKPTLPFGQLPVMTINNGPMITQSKALLRHVGASYSDTLYPPDQLLPIEEAIGVVEDFQLAIRRVMAGQKMGFPDGFYDTDEGKAVMKQLREQFVADDIPKFIQFFIYLLQKNNNKWLASSGETPTIADCYAIPILRSCTRGTMDYIPATCLDSYPEIVDYIKRFCALEPIQGRYNNGIY